MDSILQHEAVNKATDLLSILSKKDALSIFLLTKDGLKAETDTPQKIGLTRKQYYTRLKQLVDAGLIDKSGDSYLQTTLGALVHQKHLLELLEQIKNIKQMKMIDTLKRTSQFSEGDIASFVNKLTGSSIRSSALLKCRSIWNYQDMVSIIVERVNFAESEILLASRFTNEMIINAMIRKANAGVKVKVIADTDLVKRFINNARNSVEVVDEHTLERLNVVGNPWYPAGTIDRKYTQIPFSFITYDGKETAVEFVDAHDPNRFMGCMLVEDEVCSREFRAYYDKLWSAASGNLTQLLELSLRNGLNSSYNTNK